MKYLLIGINAKYIHPNLAILLLKQNSDYDVDTIEFTIKENKDKIIDYILKNAYDVIGFSCYIWNIEFIKSLIPDLKDKNNNLTIILGGPEVSYNGAYYIKNGFANYVIKNEGEEAFNGLLDFLNDKKYISDVPNLYYKDSYTYDKIVDINSIKPAYNLLNDVDKKVIYFETSRGCPYHCGYCMASLDNKVRFFDLEEIKENILLLLNKGARVIKFLDRTFNANKKNFIELIDFLILNHRPYSSFQFEITGDILDDDIINYINMKAPKKLFRFEIGIQTTNKESNILVHRIQNNDKLFHNIKLIQNSETIDLHLDLIAGLPKEDYNSFKNTFNQVLELRPKELQLGFLKLLKGTRLEKECHLYSYSFQEKAPYEIIENDSLSKEDIKNIHICEDAFEKYYNYGYMNNSIQFILNNCGNYFDFFYNLGLFYLKNRKTGLDNLFYIIDNFLLETNFSRYDEAHILLINDYLSYNNVRPKLWFNTELSKEDKNEFIRYIHTSNKTKYSLDTLYRYSLIVKYKTTYLLAIYKDNTSEVHIYKK